MKNPDNPNGNRTSDITALSAVPQPTASPCTPSPYSRQNVSMTQDSVREHTLMTRSVLPVHDCSARLYAAVYTCIAVCSLHNFRKHAMRL